MPKSSNQLITNKETINHLGSLSNGFIENLNHILRDFNIPEQFIDLLRTLFLTICIVTLGLLVWWLTRKFLIRIIHKLAGKSKTKWDDYLVEKKFFAAIAYLVPLIFMDYFIKLAFYAYPKVSVFLIKTTTIIILLVVLIGILRFLSTFEKILSEKEKLKDKPIQSYFQLGKIIVIGVMIILGLSIASDHSPIYFLTSLGAMTAIILLVFKDTILGFVGSIQLAANDMVRIGDWVTMEKYGADGDVIEITLATVKIQNFDKTITTIPTYSFISDSFKNWRGMQQSDGRRIKRSLNIEVSSIKFCTSEMLEKFKQIDFLESYINKKEKEIQTYNQNKKVKKELFLNGRNQTNIGLYRHYITEYLKINSDINQKMTLMVRQLPPTPSGVPVEIYCFSKTKEWEPYESIIADIFDHIFASTTYFDLSVFERPSGKSLKNISTTN